MLYYTFICIWPNDIMNYGRGASRWAFQIFDDIGVQTIISQTCLANVLTL